MQPINASNFPADFAWGVGTSAFQIEGAIGAEEEGRGPSIWDGGAGGWRTACDHVRRFRADVRLLASLGIRHYRLSLSWPRLVPQGVVGGNGNGSGNGNVTGLHPAAVRWYSSLFAEL